MLVPVYAAEISPAHIRGKTVFTDTPEPLLMSTIPGSLVMNWQLFVAFGIFL